MLLPVDIKIPELPGGVTCWIDGKEVTGSISRKPGDLIEVVYRRRGYVDVKQSVPVGMDDNQVLTCPADEVWRLQAVKVLVPELQDGVTCMVNGQRAFGTLLKRPHEKVICTYRRSGYKEITITHEVTDAAKQMLPKPKPSEWEFEPVQVGVPYLPAGITCWIDGREVPGGGSVTNLPGTTITCTYQRKGYNDVQKEYQVTLAAYQDMPPPTREDWKLLPVDVKIPELPSGVTCWIDDKEVTGPVSRRPGDRIVVIYRRAGYEEIKQRKEVTFEPEQRLQAPALSEWRPIEVRVKIPELPKGVTLWIDGHRQTEAIVAKPGVRLRCEYKKEGFKDVVRNYLVSSDVDQILTGPGDEWKELPVSVVVPKLEGGVEIWIDNQKVTSGTQLSLQPGLHTCKYLRQDYEPQELPFSVNYDNAEWPLPKKWKEVGILRFISEAEEALENGNPQKAQNLLRQIAADAQGSSGAALSPQNKERAKSILKQAENVESAQFRYGDGEDGSDWVGALEYLAKAVAAGYRVSNSDWEMVEDAYPKAISPSRIRKKEWEEWYKQPIKGPRPAGSYEKAKEDLEKIAQWYEQCERARR